MVTQAMSYVLTPDNVSPVVISVIGGLILAAILGIWSIFSKTGKAFWRLIIHKIIRINFQGFVITDYSFFVSSKKIKLDTLIV